MPLRKSFETNSLGKNSLTHIGCVDDRHIIFWVQTTGDDSTTSEKKLSGLQAHYEFKGNKRELQFDEKEHTGRSTPDRHQPNLQLYEKNYVR